MRPSGPGVLPFAIESGMIKANNPTTAARINMINTGGICEVIVQTPDFEVEYAGNASVDGVLGTAAPIVCNYLDIEGSTCGALLPTGNIIDIVDGIELTCIDNGMPLVVMRATDFGITGYESKEELDNNEELKTRIENIRLAVGQKMNLGDVNNQTIPKMCLISPAKNGGSINTRMFIPHVCHEAIGVLAAISVATCSLLPHSIASGIANFSDENKLLSIEHPAGEMSISINYSFENDKLIIKKSGLIRTARLLSRGEVFIPKSVWI